MMTDQERAAWLTKRRKCLGASEIGSILGLNHWASPYDVWVRKMTDTAKDEMTEAQSLGHYLESGIAGYAAKKIGLVLNEYQVFQRHSLHDWAGSTVDYLATDEDGQRVILEIKATRHEFWPELPLSYQLQAAWQAYVNGIDRVIVAVLHASTKLEAYEFDFVRDAGGWFPDVFEACRIWWQEHVVEGKPPSGMPRMDIVKTIRSTTGKRLAMTEEDRFIVAEVAEMKGRIKAIETEINSRIGILKERLGDAEIGEFEETPLVSWKQTKEREVFDGKKLKAEMPEIWSKYATKQDGGRQFLIKLKVRSDSDE